MKLRIKNAQLHGGCRGAEHPQPIGARAEKL